MASQRVSHDWVTFTFMYGCESWTIKKAQCEELMLWASLIAQLVKNLPGMRETPVQFLGWEDPLEKGKATHSSILAWRIPWTV